MWENGPFKGLVWEYGSFKGLMLEYWPLKGLIWEYGSHIDPIAGRDIKHNPITRQVSQRYLYSEAECYFWKAVGAKTSGKSNINWENASQRGIFWTSRKFPSLDKNHTNHIMQQYISANTNFVLCSKGMIYLHCCKSIQQNLRPRPHNTCISVITWTVAQRPRNPISSILNSVIKVVTSLTFPNYSIYTFCIQHKWQALQSQQDTN